MYYVGLELVYDVCENTTLLMLKTWNFVCSQSNVCDFDVFLCLFFRITRFGMILG